MSLILESYGLNIQENTNTNVINTLNSGQLSIGTDCNPTTFGPTDTGKYMIIEPEKIQQTLIQNVDDDWLVNPFGNGVANGVDINYHIPIGFQPIAPINSFNDYNTTFTTKDFTFTPTSGNYGFYLENESTFYHRLWINGDGTITLTRANGGKFDFISLNMRFLSDDGSLTITSDLGNSLVFDTNNKTTGGDSGETINFNWSGVTTITFTQVNIPTIYSKMRNIIVQSNEENDLESVNANLNIVSNKTVDIIGNDLNIDLQQFNTTVNFLHDFDNLLPNTLEGQELISSSSDNYTSSGLRYEEKGFQAHVGTGGIHFFGSLNTSSVGTFEIKRADGGAFNLISVELGCEHTASSCHWKLTSDQSHLFEYNSTLEFTDEEHTFNWQNVTVITVEQLSSNSKVFTDKWVLEKIGGTCNVAGNVNTAGDTRMLGDATVGENLTVFGRAKFPTAINPSTTNWLHTYFPDPSDGNNHINGETFVHGDLFCYGGGTVVNDFNCGDIDCGDIDVTGNVTISAVGNGVLVTGADIAVRFGDIEVNESDLGTNDIHIRNGGDLNFYGGQINYLSTRDAKENIRDSDEDFKKLLNVNVKEYNYKGQEKNKMGVIAEELDELGLQKLVGYKNDKPSCVDYVTMNLYLLELVKENDKRIKVLEDELEARKDKKKKGLMSKFKKKK